MISLCNLCVLCVSVVVVSNNSSTTATQRLHRAELTQKSADVRNIPLTGVSGL